MLKTHFIAYLLYIKRLIVQQFVMRTSTVADYLFLDKYERLCLPSCVWILKITEILKTNFTKWIIEKHDFNLQIISQLLYNTRGRLKCSYECKKTTSFIPIFRNHSGIFDFTFFSPVLMSRGWKPPVALGPTRKSILHCGNETTNCKHNKAVLRPYLQLHCCHDWFKLPLIIANII